MTPRRAVLIALTALAALPAQPASAAPHTCNGSAALCARTFDRVVLPATHNSMSNAADHFVVPNQEVGIPAQLRAGVRGFLVDTYLLHGKVYLCHLTCDNGATAFAQTLRAMASFLKAHPSNVLLIDNEDHTPPADFIKAVDASPLHHHLYRGSTSTWRSLGWMIRHHQQVVMLAEGNATGAPWYHLDYAGIVQETPYTFDTEQQLTDPAQQPASCAPNRGGTIGSLFLMNHWSPPFGANEPEAARVNARSVLLARARACAIVRGKAPTIVAVDMFRAGDLFGAVRELNAHPPPTSLTPGG